MGGAIGSALGSVISGRSLRAAVGAAGGRPQGLARGVRVAGQGFFSRLWRAVHALFLEVVGVLFLLMGLAASPSTIRAWKGLRPGDSLSRPILLSAFVALFLYFGLSSFWRAAKKSK